MKHTAPRDSEKQDEPKAQIPAVYDLRGLAEDRNEGARCLPDQPTSELKAIVAQVATAVDVEYPSPRKILESDSRLTDLLDQPAGGRPKAAPPSESGRGPAEEAQPIVEKGRRDVRDTQALVAFGGMSLSVLAAAAAIAGAEYLLLVVAALVFALSFVALLIIWMRTKAPAKALHPSAGRRPPASLRRPMSSRSGEKDQGVHSDLALSPHADPRQAAKVALRTGGLGLLVRPADDSVLDQPEHHSQPSRAEERIAQDDRG
jgi:hypothetical protein